VTSGADIKLAIPVSGRVSLKVYDVQGRLVNTLLDSKAAAGEYAVHWAGANSNGRRVASGIYFMKLETLRGSIVKKMVISR
jgi:flagellar hook assembly protein FlgD